MGVVAVSGSVLRGDHGPGPMHGPVLRGGHRSGPMHGSVLRGDHRPGSMHGSVLRAWPTVVDGGGSGFTSRSTAGPPPRLVSRPAPRPIGRPWRFHPSTWVREPGRGPAGALTPGTDGLPTARSARPGELRVRERSGGSSLRCVSWCEPRRVFHHEVASKPCRSRSCRSVTSARPHRGALTSSRSP